MPTEKEFQAMIDSAGGSSGIRDKTWSSGNNWTKFSALPGGYVLNSQSFRDLGNATRFWTSTVAPVQGEVVRLILNSSRTYFGGNNAGDARYYIRCINQINTQ